MSSPTQRSLELLRSEGYLCEVVERWIRFPSDYAARVGRPGNRKDLFGFVDILAIHPVHGTLAVQACTGAGGAVAERRRKLAEEPNVATCKLAGWQIEIWGWVKRKIKRGGKAVRYEVRREKI